MKFGYFTHVWHKRNMTPAQRYQLLWRELALADEVGFDYGFTVEHHFSPNESWMPTPSIFCTGAAMHTRRMRIGPMGYLVPLYNPLRILEEAAVLDQVLDGRLELGLVSGILPQYFRHYGADFDNKRALTNEAVSLVKAAFASNRFSFNGRFHQYEDVELSVKPVQKPHPPLWLQSRDPETLRFLAQEGVHTGYLFFLPREETAPRYHEYVRLWRQAGHTYEPNIAYYTLIFVAETDEDAIAQASAHVIHTYLDIGGFGDGGGISPEALAANLAKRGETGAAEIAGHLADVQYLLARNLIFIGSPETVTRNIRAAADEGYFNTLLGEFNFGYLEEEQATRSIRLFAERVMPALRR